MIMNKDSFIMEIRPKLKARGFRKNGNYWYKDMQDYICCIQVEGSSWSKDHYYVNIGFALSDDSKKNPTLLHWYCRHRCKHGNERVSPEELLLCVEDIFGSVSSAAQIPEFLQKCNAQKVASQFWF